MPKNSFNFPSWEEIEAGRQVNYEDSVARRLLTTSGLRERIHGFQGDREDINTLLSLSEVVTAIGFPVWLQSAKLPYLDTLDIDLEKRATKTPVFKAFAEAYDSIPEYFSGSPAVGVVFSWPNRGQFKIFHDAPRAAESLGKCGRFLRIGKDKRLHYLEDFDDFIRSFGTPADW